MVRIQGGIKVLVHSFYLMDFEKINRSKGSSFNYKNLIIELKLRRCVNISDEIVFNNSMFLSGFEAHHCLWENKKGGLCYHGISVIEYIETSKFLINLKKCRIKLKNKKEINELIELIESIKKNECVIHFGV
jgi:hypothetical protein